MRPAWKEKVILRAYSVAACILHSSQALLFDAGIGRSIHRIEQIEQLQRPLTMEDGGVVLMDLLWSDPTTNDGVEGVQPSPRGPGLVTFGPDRVKDFCKVSQHKLILRSPQAFIVSPLQAHLLAFKTALMQLLWLLELSLE